MLSHDEMVRLQSEQHDMVETSNFKSVENYILHLKHKFAYHQAISFIKGKRVLDVGCNIAQRVSDM